jgi:ribosomal protein S10
VRLAEVAERGHAAVEGPIPLPSQPAAVDGLRTHVRRLDLLDAPPELLASLANFDLPSGVEIELAG